MRVQPELPGQESYPMTMSTSKVRPRPKSMVLGSSDFQRIKKYKSVVTLKASDSPTSSSGYQRAFVPRTPHKSTSPTHEALVRHRRLSSSNYYGIEPPSTMMTTSEYFSNSHSSEESDTWLLENFSWDKEKYMLTIHPEMIYVYSFAFQLNQGVY